MRCWVYESNTEVKADTEMTVQEEMKSSKLTNGTLHHPLCIGIKQHVGTQTVVVNL